MRTFHRLVLLILSVTLLYLSGCVGANRQFPEVTFYTLEYEPRPLNDRQPLPALIRVQRFAVAPFYASDRIIYQEKAYQREAYHYHRWRVTPGALVTYFIARDMRQSGLFKAVAVDNQRLMATHFIEGSLDEFYEQDQTNGWKAILSMTITLVNANEPERHLAVCFQKHYTAAEPCENENPQAVARAMSAAMATLSQEIISDVYDAISGQNKTD